MTRYHKRCSICRAIILYPTIHIRVKHKLENDSTEYKEALAHSVAERVVPIREINKTPKIILSPSTTERSAQKAVAQIKDPKTLSKHDKLQLRELYQQILTGSFKLDPMEKHLLAPYAQKMRDKKLNPKLTTLIKLIAKRR